MTDVTFKQIEYHSMTITKTMSTDAKSIEENGLTVERFKEIMSHQEQAGWGYTVDPMGEEPTDEETDMFFEIVNGCQTVLTVKKICGLTEKAVMKLTTD